MKSVFPRGFRSYWVASMVVPLLLFILACGPGEEPTPTSTPSSGPGAIPTPTSVATPTPTPSGLVAKRGGSIIQVSSYTTQYDPTRGSSPRHSHTLPKLFLSQMYDDGPTDSKEFICDLCKDWYLENSGKTIVFELHGEATFHDGTVITSRDMKYSLEKIMGRVDDVANVRTGFVRLYIDTIDTPDDLTMKVNLFRPAPIVPAILTVSFAGIIPEGTESAELTAPPVGPNSKYLSGPYYIADSVKDSHLVLERNPNYFKKDKNGVQLPYLDTIRMQAFENSTASYTALLTGRVDVFNTRSPVVEQFRVPLLNKVVEGKLNHILQPFGATRTIFLQVQTPVLKDITVRQAINFAFDREDYADSLYGPGYYVGALLMSHSNFWSRPPDDLWNVLPGWGTGAKKQEEIEQAKERLKQAGFGDTPLELPLLTSSAASFGSETWQRQMVNVGINATLDVQERTTRSRRQATADFVTHAWSATLATWDPDEIIGNGFVTGGSYNWSRASDPWVDEQFLVMSSEQDPAKRKQVFFGIEDYLVEQVIYLSAPDSYKDNYWIASIRGMEPGAGFLKASHDRGEAWWSDE